MRSRELSSEVPTFRRAIHAFSNEYSALTALHRVFLHLYTYVIHDFYKRLYDQFIYMLNMKSEQFSTNILNLDSAIRFAGIVEKSGHLYAGNTRTGIKEHLKGRDPELSLAQSAYIVDLRRMFTSELGNLRYVIYTYDKVKMISIPVKDHVLVFSADDSANTDHLIDKVSQYIESVESELSLYPPSNIINNEKREIVRNLHISGIPENMIADQLDLDINTVKMLIQEISS